MKKQDKYDREWAEAKRRCRLNQEDIRMAKELGFRPRSLIKNIPSESQQWKAPVKDWIRDLYEKRQRKIADRKSAKKSKPSRETSGTANSPPGQDKHESKPDSEPVSRAVERWERLLESIPLTPTEREKEILLAEDIDDRAVPTREEIEEENILMLRRQKKFRLAAQYVAKEFAQFPWVEKVALFGSVAPPLRKEVPRFHKYRRAGIEIWHECKDVDLAIWVSELGDLNALRKAKSRAVNELHKDTDGFVGIAHHQVDVFVIEPDTDRYLGTLCNFNACPKDKPECRVKDCGADLFLRQHVGFRLRPDALDPSRIMVLFMQESGAQDDEIPF